ncbi:MAG: TylF/MycF/NovP-related O-methyltransferase, partial [Candidatus Kapaibacteriota bacterium]
MYALYNAVEYIVKSGITGDFVECGVWKGGSTMLMALTLLKMKETNRKIYLYDTFEGMTQPTELDYEVSNNNARTIDVWEKYQKNDFNEWCFASLPEVKNNMKLTGYPENNLVFVKGRVEETIPKTIPFEIA